MDYKTLRETDETVVILPGARVNGDVTFGRGCSVWFNAVIRGDQAPITIGENTNIQDNSTLHTSDRRSMSLGSGISVGHNVVLHSCTVGDNCLDRHGGHRHGRGRHRQQLHRGRGGAGH